MTDYERVRTEQFIAFSDLPVDRVVHEAALAEVARLRQLYEAEAAEVVSLNDEVARLGAELEHERDVLQFTSQQTDAAELEVDSLRADLDRALDALRQCEKALRHWACGAPSPAADRARAVLAAHDREAR